MARLQLVVQGGHDCRCAVCSSGRGGAQAADHCGAGAGRELAGGSARGARTVVWTCERGGDCQGWGTDYAAAAGAGGVIREVYVDRDGRYVLAVPLQHQHQQDQDPEQQLAPQGGRYADASAVRVPVRQGFGGEEAAGGALVLPVSAAQRLVVGGGGGGGGGVGAGAAQGRLLLDVRHGGAGQYVLAKRVAAGELHDGALEPPALRQRV